MRRLLACLLVAIAPCLAPLPPASAAGVSVHLAVSPNPMRRDQPDAVLLAVTAPGALCRARVRYAGGRDIGLPARRALSQGLAVWVWHPAADGPSAVASVTCTLGAASATATAGIRVLR